MRNIFLSVLIFIFLAVPAAFAETYSANQLIPAGHWLYDALYELYGENSKAFLLDSAPLSVNEIRQSVDYIEYDRLSDSGKALYNRINEYLDEKKLTFNMKPVKVGVNFNFHPSAVYKSNDEIKWSFANDFSGKEEGYGAASGYYENFLTSPFIRIPLYIDFADVVVIDCQASISKNFWSMSTPDYFTNNLLLNGSDFEFSWPINANASTGYVFKDGIAEGLAINFHVARTGLQYGHTQTGSIIYNNTFQTDFYTQLRLSGQKLKYEMMVAEVDHTKFLYTHQIDFTVWDWLKLGVLEGTLLHEPFELRYLNPLMIMHSFASWTEYADDFEKEYYGEGHVCAYMGIKFDLVPCRNLRIYGLFSQTEVQPPTELGSPEANSLPDGLGFQLGADFTHADKHGGIWKYNLEGVYTNPYLYVKHGADWSMYRTMDIMNHSAEGPVCSWIGTPFGPDAFGGQFTVEYKQLDKWKAGASYLFMAHGENSFGMFSKKTTVPDDAEKYAGREYYYYYPAVQYRIGKDGLYGGLSAEDSEAAARSWNLTGTVQYTNRLGLFSFYRFNSHFMIEGQAIYNIIYNNKNISGNLQHGVELGLAGTYYLF